MILKTSIKNSDLIEIEERLKELSLSFQVVENQLIKDVVLEDSGREIIGKKAILKHLEELSGELNKWYYCDC